MRNKRKCIMGLSIVAVLGVLFALTTYAWFALFSRRVQSTPMNIGFPPEIVVLNNETTALDVLNLDGLEVGTTYRVVFCVSSSAENSVKDYKLQLAYTTNLGENIDLYQAEYFKSEDRVNGELPPTAGSDDVMIMQSRDGNQYLYYQIGEKLSYELVAGDAYQPEDRVQECNVGVYKVYQGAFDAGLWDKPYDMGDTKHYRFYLLEISWDDPNAPGFSAVNKTESKETDMLYVSVIGITTENQETSESENE